VFRCCCTRHNTNVRYTKNIFAQTPHAKCPFNPIKSKSSSPQNGHCILLLSGCSSFSFTCRLLASGTPNTPVYLMAFIPFCAKIFLVYLTFVWYKRLISTTTQFSAPFPVVPYRCGYCYFLLHGDSQSKKTIKSRFILPTSAPSAVVSTIQYLLPPLSVASESKW